MLADFCPRRGSLEVLGKGKTEFSKPQGQRLPGNSRLLICSSICCHRCHLRGREEGRWEPGSGARSNPCSPAAAPSAPRAAGPASAAAPPGPGRGSCRNPGGSRRGTARKRGCQGHLKRLRDPQRERESKAAPAPSSEPSNSCCIPSPPQPQARPGDPQAHPARRKVPIPQEVTLITPQMQWIPPSQHSPRPQPGTELAAPSASRTGCSWDSSFIYFSLPRSCCCSSCA